MSVIVSGIALPFEEAESHAIEQAVRVLKGCAVRRAWIAKKSVDARREIRFVYAVGLDLEEDEAAVVERLHRADVQLRLQTPLEIRRGSGVLTHRPVVIGFGPAGMFSALLLAQHGLRPIVLERGAAVETRVAQVEGFWSTGALHPNSNVQFGEGGAGTFSDGKLVTRIGDARCRFVLEQLAAHGAPEEILYQAKPHIGTDRLRGVVRAVREEICRLGGEVRFETRVEALEIREGRLRGIVAEGVTIPAEVVALAPGHSARDLFEQLLRQQVPMEGKPFSVGVRIEHLQDEIDKALYRQHAGHPLLPKGEYQLSHREDGRAVYTFCMCPGGVVVPAASEEGMLVTNGMSEYSRSGSNANSALVVSVAPEDYGARPLDGMEFQRRLERAAFLAGGGGYRAPAQSVGRLLESKAGLAPGRISPTYACGITEGDFDKILPAFVTDLLRTGLERFGRKMPGFADPDAVLTGIESRTSSPVRIPRGENMQSVGVEGLYPCGEGAGYAGGIVSAAVDGIRTAQAILGEFGEVGA